MSSLEENIKKGVVSGNMFSLLPTPDGMVTILSVPDVETESEVGDAVQQVATRREGERVKVGLVTIIGGGVQEKAVGETVQLSSCTDTVLVSQLLLLSVKFGLAVQQPLFSLKCCLQNMID